MSQGIQEIDALRKALHSLSEGAKPGPDCPAPEKIWAALAGETADSEVRILVDHTISCASCAQAWRLAQELEGSRAPGKAPARRWGVRRWQVVAAVAATLIILGVLPFLRLAGGRGPAYRDTNQGAVRSVVNEAEPLPRERCILRWTAGPTGSRYDVQVTSEDLKVLARGESLESTDFQVPAEALASLPAGGRIYWRVETILEDGSRIVSDTFLATLR